MRKFINISIFIALNIAAFNLTDYVVTEVLYKLDVTAIYNLIGA